MHPGGGPPNKPLPICPLDLPARQPAVQPATQWKRAEITPKYGLREFQESKTVRKAMLHYAMVNTTDDTPRFEVKKSDGGAYDLNGPQAFNQLMFLRLMEQYHERPTMFKADIINATCAFNKRNTQQKSRFEIEKPDGLAAAIVTRHTEKARRHKEHVKAADTRELKLAVEANDLAPQDLFKALEQHVLEGPVLQQFFREFNAADRKQNLVANCKSLAGNPPANGCPENFQKALNSVCNLLDGSTRREKLRLGGKTGDDPNDAEVFAEDCAFDVADLGLLADD